MKALFLMILALVLAIPASAQEMAAGGGEFYVTSVVGRLVDASGAPVEVYNVRIDQIDHYGGNSSVGSVYSCNVEVVAAESDECVDAATGAFLIRLYSGVSLRGLYRLVVTPSNSMEHAKLVHYFSLSYARGRIELGALQVNRTRRVDLDFRVPQGGGTVQVTGQISSALPAETDKVVQVDIDHSIMTPIGERFVKKLFSAQVSWSAGTQQSSDYPLGDFAVKATDKVGMGYCVTATVSDISDRFVVYAAEKVCRWRPQVGYDVPQ